MKKLYTLALSAIIATSAFAQTEYTLQVNTADGRMIYIPATELDSINILSGFDKEAVKVEVTELSSTSAKFLFTPKDESTTYYFSLLEEDSYQRLMNQYGSIQAMDKAWWAFQAAMQDPALGLTWKDSAFAQASTGVIEDSYQDFYKWGTSYRVYAYELTKDLEISPYISEIVFTTPEPTPSENVITAEITGRDGNYVTVKVTTTNDDPYYIDVKEAAPYDDEFEKFKGNTEDVFKTIMEDLEGWVLEGEEIFSGSKEFEFKASKLGFGRTYYVIVCGYDGGNTTEVQFIPFNEETFGSTEE